MAPRPGKQIITIHILLNISKRSGNQLIKYGQLIEYNMRNTFFDKLFTKFGGESIPRPFYQKINK